MADQNSTQTGEVDLFGHPVVPIRDRRGRPSFKKTAENQEFVASRAAWGWSQARIAENMGIDEKTLRKNFSRELHSGAVLVEGMMLDVLIHRAKQGHVPSVRLVMERMETVAPRRRDRPLDEVDEDVPSKVSTAAAGKKVQRDDAAQDVPDEYGDLYARLRRDN